MPRWWFVLALVLVASTIQVPAFADPASTTTDRPRIRDHLLSGRSDEARAAIADGLAGATSPDERAALLELHSMGTAWGWQQPPQADSSPLPTAADETPHLSAAEWSASLGVARADLARGAFRAAALRLNALVRQAPDLIDVARATELRSLAYDALRARWSTEYAHSEPPAEGPGDSSTSRNVAPSKTRDAHVAVGANVLGLLISRYSADFVVKITEAGALVLSPYHIRASGQVHGLDGVHGTTPRFTAFGAEVGYRHRLRTDESSSTKSSLWLGLSGVAAKQGNATVAGVAIDLGMTIQLRQHVSITSGAGLQCLGGNPRTYEGGEFLIKMRDVFYGAGVRPRLIVNVGFWL